MTVSIDPIIATIGGVSLRWYSLIILGSIVLAVVITRREAARRWLPVEAIDDLVPLAIVAGIVGARVSHVLDNWDRYAADPARILNLQAGGLAIYGAVIGGTLAAAVYAWARHISFWRLADAITPGLLVAQVAGRFACVVNGDAYGAPTNLPWGFTYTNPAAFISRELLGVPTHPYPVYEMLWNLIVLAAIWRLRGHSTRPGTLFLVYAALYSAGRLLLSTVRQESMVVFDLQEAQVIALAVLVAASLLLTIGAAGGTASAVGRGVAAGSGDRH